MLKKRRYKKKIPISKILHFKFLNDIFVELMFDVYLLPNRIIYITSSDIDQYLIRIYGNGDTIKKIKRIYIWELKKFIESHECVMIDMPKLLAPFFNDGFLIPQFVRQVLDIKKPIEDAIKIRHKSLKKVYKYDYEVTNDVNKLKFFYEKMYSHYIKERFKDSAYIEPFDNLEKILKNGELILTKFDGKYVSGALCEIEEDVYFLRKNGVIDENFIDEGALLTTYYFPILRAKERNAKSVDFGQSRPFLSDGVLRHKSFWGTEICEDKNIKRIIYLKNVINQPFIYIENNKLKAAMFSENDKLIKDYARSGLEFNIIGKDNIG